MTKTIIDEPAHFIDDDGDRGWNIVTPCPHWRQFLECSDGRFVIGLGGTKEDAESDASLKRQKVEEFLNKPDLVKLIELVQPDKSYSESNICWADMNSAVKIITKILLNKI